MQSAPRLDPSVSTQLPEERERRRGCSWPAGACAVPRAVVGTAPLSTRRLHRAAHALQALLNKSMPKPLAHITSLKHLVELKLGDSSGGSGGVAPGSRGGSGDIPARFACPITGLPFNGKSRFAVLRSSGHVLSERALKEVRAGGGGASPGSGVPAKRTVVLGCSAGFTARPVGALLSASASLCAQARTLLVCATQVPKVVEEMVGGPWQPEDLLPVNPTGDELQAMREALLLKRTAERAAKKEKKKDKAAAAANGGSTVEAVVPAAENGKAAAGGKRSAENGVGAGGAAAAAALNGGDDAAAAAATAKRFKAAELKPKGADEKVWSSIFTSKSGKQGGNDYMIRGFTRYV